MRKARKLFQVVEDTTRNGKRVFIGLCLMKIAKELFARFAEGEEFLFKEQEELVAPHPLRVDELIVVLTEVEAVLNSRPLVAIDQTESEDELVLTPAHFLIFQPMKASPTAPVSKAKINTLSRWRLVQRLKQEFAQAWRLCYLQSLEARTKWKRKKQNVKEGDLVLIKDTTLLTSYRWPLGEVVKVYPGKDNLVRAVNVLCHNKVYRRAVHMSVPLLLEEPDGEHKDEG